MKQFTSKLKLTSIVVLIQVMVLLFFASIKAQSTYGQLKDTSGYSVVPFDTSAQDLPLDYLGHNARNLYWAMEQKIQRSYKDEFETTEENKRRFQSEFNKPILGRLDIRSMFAFKVNRLEASYDADNKILSVGCPLQTASSKRTPDAKSISWSSEFLDKGTYLGTNAFGASVEVSRSSYIDYDVVISNYDIIPSETRGEGFSRQSCYPIRIQASAEDARRLKQSVSALVIGEIYQPFTSSKENYYQATFDSPSQMTFSTFNFHIELFHVWFYDPATGKVFAKLRRNPTN